MISELSPVHGPLTIEVAKKHAELPQIQGDRNLMTSRINHLAEAHANGLFHSPTWATCYCKENNKTYRINGKHTSNFLAGLNGSFPSSLSVTVLRFECDTVAELPILFEQFDTRFSMRTSGDVLNVHKSLHPELYGIKKTSITKCVQGIAKYFKLTTEGPDMTLDDQSQLLHQYPEFVKWCDEYTGNRKTNKSGIIAAMFATHQLNPELATQFWPLVREQNHSDVKNATRVLGKFLEITLFNPSDPISKTKWDMRAYYAKCIHAWNAWRKGSSTDLKYHAGSPLPIPK